MRFLFFNTMNDLLFDSPPLVIQKELACKVGINEAIILQQIHYWCENNRKTNRNFHDGRYWTYNTFDQWAEQFPWLTKRHIQNLFAKLEKSGYLISGNYNKMKMDRTKWYTLDYEKIKENPPLRKNFVMQDEDSSLSTTKIVRQQYQRIPENTSHRITEKELSVINSENAVSDLRETRAREERKEAFKVLGEKAREAFADPKNQWAIDLVNKYINEWYEQETGCKHKQMGKALRMIYAYKLVECQQITENDRCAEIEPTDFENALKLAIQCHDCKDPTIMWVTDDKVLGYWLVESGGCFYQDIMSTKYGFSDDAEKAFENWKTDLQRW